MNQLSRRRKTTLGIAAAIAFGIGAAHAAAPAATPIASAHAYDFSISINLLITRLDVPAQTSTSIVDSNTATGDTDELTSLDVADPMNLIKVKTGVLTSEAQHAAGGLSVVAAESVVNQLDLSAVGIANVDVLAIKASTITSRSVLTGSCPATLPRPSGLLDEFVYFNGFDEGNLAIGDPGGGGSGGGLPDTGAELGDLQIRIIGTPIVNLPPLPPPNTAIDLAALGIVGATLVLNERTVGGDGAHSLSVSTNSLRLTLNVAGLVTANIIIGHSEASLQCP